MGARIVLDKRMEYYPQEELGQDKGQFNRESKRILQEGLEAAYEYEEQERKKPQRFFYEFPGTKERDDAKAKIVEDTEFNDYFRQLDGGKLIAIGDRGLEINFARTAPENEQNLEKFFRTHYGYGAVRKELSPQKGEVISMPKKKAPGEEREHREAA